MRINNPDYLLDLIHQQLFDLLVERGGAEAAALADAEQFCTQLQEQAGGRRHYIPAPGKGQRNQRIAADLRDGHAPQAVAERHGVSTKTVARVASRTDDDRGGFGSKDWNL